MAKSDIRQCSYSHCKHKTKEINIGTDEYKLVGNKYYHPDCKHEKDVIQQIKDYWYEVIDKNVVFSSLVRIINMLIYHDGYDADYVLFALKKSSKFLNYPPGLVYSVKNKDNLKAWEKEQRIKAFNGVKHATPEAKEEPTFRYKNGSTKKFSDIFGG